MKTPLISVIIPTYNRMQYICETIDSVLEQTYKNIEIIVVDDGSIDNTKDVLSRYGSKISYIYQNNAGPSAARNNGIKQSNGELLAFLDSDDIWLQQKLEKQLELIQQSPDIGLVSCGSYDIDSSGNIIGEPFIQRNYKSRELLVKALILRNVVGGGSFPLIRRECFDKLGLFSEDIIICEDRDMWIRIAKRYEIKFIEEPLIKYRIHETNLNKDVTRIKNSTRKLIERNVDKKHSLLKRKAYSCLYITLAWEYMDRGDRYSAIKNIIKSIVSYPLKAGDQNGKYKTLCKLIMPSYMLNFFRTLYKKII